VSPLPIVLAVTFLFWAASTLVLFLSGSVPVRAPGTPRPPMWSSVWLWIAATATLFLIGTVVAPRLVGIVFVLLPMAWMRRSRRDAERERRPDDREEL
jgi:hypothetical protein